MEVIMEHLSVDRFEEGFAVCETKDMDFIDIPKSQLPEGVHEGDIILKKENGYVIDRNETEKSKERIKAKMNRLFKR